MKGFVEAVFAADLILLLVVLSMGAGKGLTIRALWNLCWSANRRFWRGDPDWWKEEGE